MSITFQLSSGPTAQAINLANSNACALLALAGLPATSFGELDPTELPAVIRRLLRAANSRRSQMGAVTEDVSSESGRWVESGRSQAYVEQRVMDLLTLCREAQVHGCRVVWN